MWQDGKESNPGRGPHQKHSWATLRIQVGFGPAKVRGSSKKELGSLGAGVGWGVWGAAGNCSNPTSPELPWRLRDAHGIPTVSLTKTTKGREGKGNNLCLPVGECL